MILHDAENKVCKIQFAIHLLAQRASLIYFGQHPRTRGIFFHWDFSTEETKLKINIHLSRVKASGLSWIPSVTPNVPKNEV